MGFSFRASVALLLAGLVLAAAPAPAEDREPALRAVAALDGQSLRLANGTTLRLAGIVAPDAGLRAERGIALQAQRALEAMVAGQILVAQPPPTRRDRHDRLLLHVTTAQGQWVQGELVRQGLARVWTQPDAIERAAELLALEAEARAAGRGLWALPYFAILTPETAATGLDRFQIIEAVVVDVARVRGTVYLNTGPDWRSDLTMRIERPGQRLFAAAGQDVAALKGRRIRVRGWLRLYNGPFVDVTHPQQIEVIGQ